MHSIVIIEDHPVMRRGLAGFFAGSGRWQVLGTAPNLEEAKSLLAMPETAAVNIVLLDLRLNETWGLDLIPWLKAFDAAHGRENTPVLVYSGFEDYAHVSAAIAMGARGYVSKRRGEAELEAALDVVLQGGIYTDKEAELKLQSADHAVSLLTKREAEIFMAAKKGLSNSDIARNLGISRRTVENILHCIYDKTGIASRLELQKM
jgi:DNA-binding NarL/FixJ family response regulator